MQHIVHLARRATRLRAGRAVFVLLPILGACDAEWATSPDANSPPPAVADEPAAARLDVTKAATTSCTAPSSARVVKVNSATGLKSALKSARPGDFILLADGRYSGRFEATQAGTARAPITVCGSERAELNGGSLSGGYGLYLNGARYWVFRGFTVTNAMKGVIFDYAYNNVLERLSVHDVRDEVVHLRRYSSNNVLRNNHVYRGGRGSSHGEGVYLGSAKSNWCSYTSCKPDAVSNNQIIDNLIEDMTAEGIELKEGTRHNLIDGNTVRRAGQQKSSGSVGATASIATRGGNSTFTDNTIIGCSTTCPVNGVQVYSGGNSGDGDYNTFKGNTVDVQSSGYGFSISNTQTGNVVGCNNTVRNAKRGMSNVRCS